MRWMLDTSTAVEVLRRAPKALLDRIAAQSPGSGCISCISVAELWYGLERSHRHSARWYTEALERFLGTLGVIPFDDTAAMHYATIRTYLESRGQTIGPLDMLIAAHAISLDCTMITGNVREFSRVPGLHVEDWGVSP